MAIWDNVLSEHDRKVLKARPSRSSRGLGERPAVLVIDMNCGAVGENRPNYDQVDEYPGACGLFAWTAIPHMQDVIHAAREADIPVVYTKLIFKATHDLPRAGRPREGHVSAGRVPGHLQRAGHEALDGAGPVPAGDSEGIVSYNTRCRLSIRTG